MRRKRSTAAGVVVFHRDRSGDCRFLLLLSRLTKKPLWEFPKGGVDTGESVLDAALRELEEETGLARGDIRLVPDFERTEEYRFSVGGDRGRTLVHKHVTYYLAEAEHREVRLSADEAYEHAWLDVDEAERRVRYAGRRRLLRAAARAAGCAGIAATEGNEASDEHAGAADGG